MSNAVCNKKTNLTLQQACSISILDDNQFPPAAAPTTSSPSTQKDKVYENFKFPIPEELKSSKGKPSETVLHKFIRDCVACLEALYGNDNLDISVLTAAATKICDCVPILKDKRPRSYYSDKNFPYWVK